MFSVKNLLITKLSPRVLKLSPLHLLSHTRLEATGSKIQDSVLIPFKGNICKIGGQEKIRRGPGVFSSG